MRIAEGQAKRVFGTGFLSVRVRQLLAQGLSGLHTHAPWAPLASLSLLCLLSQARSRAPCQPYLRGVERPPKPSLCALFWCPCPCSCLRQQLLGPSKLRERPLPSLLPTVPLVAFSLPLLSLPQGPDPEPTAGPSPGFPARLPQRLCPLVCFVPFPRAVTPLPPIPLQPAPPLPPPDPASSFYGQGSWGTG